MGWGHPMFWGSNMPETQTKGDYAKGGKSPQTWPNQRGDPGWKAYAKSDRAAKINERSVAKQMPLLGEFPGYSEWETDARRWTSMLYNRPVSLVIDYSVINLKDSEARTDKESSGYLKYKLKAKTDKLKKIVKMRVSTNL